MNVIMKPQPDSELLREGFRSYHKALFAVMQFRREVQESIRAAIDERIDDIAAALHLGKAELSKGLSSYADPANYNQNWDGSHASVGLKYPGKDWEAKWSIYFYFRIGDSETSSVCAHCWFQEPGEALKQLAAQAERMEFSDHAAWICEPIGEPPDGFTTAIHRALDRWIDVWRKVGGISQFVPSARGATNQG